MTTKFPKVQVREVYDAKGADAAREKAKELGIENHRIVRWIDREWPAKGGTPTAKADTKPAPKKATKGKAAVKKAAPKKATAKKAAPKATSNPAPAA